MSPAEALIETWAPHTSSPESFRLDHANASLGHAALERPRPRHLTPKISGLFPPSAQHISSVYGRVEPNPALHYPPAWGLCRWPMKHTLPALASPTSQHSKHRHSLTGILSCAASLHGVAPNTRSTPPDQLSSCLDRTPLAPHHSQPHPSLTGTHLHGGCAARPPTGRRSKDASKYSVHSPVWHPSRAPANNHQGHNFHLGY